MPIKTHKKQKQAPRKRVVNHPAAQVHKADKSVTHLINEQLKAKKVEGLDNLCLVEVLNELNTDQLDICIIYVEYKEAYKASEMLKKDEIPTEKQCKSLVRVFNRLDQMKLKNRLSFSSYLKAITILEEGSL